MGRNKDSLIELAAKLTGENCGEVKTKKDALKKIACFYAGQEVECNTVADALQCIAEHCGGSGGVSGGEVTLYYHLQNEDPAKYYLTQDPIANIGKEQTLISIVGSNINTSTVTVTAATESYSKVTTENGSTLTLIRSSSGDITFDCGGSSGGSGETITPYAEKVYTGRGYTTALIFDHTQITGECTYTDIDGGVSNINLSTRTTNLYLDSTDIVSFELEINGSKVTVNVNE